MTWLHPVFFYFLPSLINHPEWAYRLATPLWPYATYPQYWICIPNVFTVALSWSSASGSMPWARVVSVSLGDRGDLVPSAYTRADFPVTAALTPELGAVSHLMELWPAAMRGQWGCRDGREGATERLMWPLLFPGPPFGPAGRLQTAPTGLREVHAGGPHWEGSGGRCAHHPRPRKPPSLPVLSI